MEFKLFFWLMGVVSSLIILLFGFIWREIGKLRQVRHEDREAISRTSADIDILLHDYKKLIDHTTEELEELKRENGILKFMLKQAGSDSGGVLKN